MRDENQEFADIVKQEFDEHWSPPSEPPPELKRAVQPAPVPQPLPDFHLDLYDDDESYRQVPHTTWTMPPLMSRGLVVIGIGLVIAILKILFARMPAWAGWIAVACFIAGTSMCVWHLTHTPKDGDDRDGTV